jgi:hypothetical protein
MKKTVFTSFLLPDSNEVILCRRQCALSHSERRLLRMNCFVRFLAMTMWNYEEPTNLKK